jgi:CYTH domain-containing protein
METKVQTEIERKWLIANLPDLSKERGEKIIQKYITQPTDSVEIRIRQKGKLYFFTMKSLGSLSRKEIECKISKKLFLQIMISIKVTVNSYFY